MSSLHKELKKTQPFSTIQQEVVLNLFRTNDLIQIQFTRLFREHGLTSSQYNILRILRGAAEPLSCQEIASRTVTVVPGLTGLIDRLEEAGLVKRVRSVDDRRKIFVSITAKGKKLLAKIDQPLMELHMGIVGHMNEEELHRLNNVLTKLRTQIPSPEIYSEENK